MTTKKKVFLLLLLAFMAGFLFADGDIMAMLRKHSFVNQATDDPNSTYGDPYDVYDFLRTMSTQNGYYDSYSDTTRYNTAGYKVLSFHENLTPPPGYLLDMDGNWGVYDFIADEDSVDNACKYYDGTSYNTSNPFNIPMNAAQDRSLLSTLTQPTRAILGCTMSPSAGESNFVVDTSLDSLDQVMPLYYERDSYVGRNISFVGVNTLDFSDNSTLRNAFVSYLGLSSAEAAKCSGSRLMFKYILSYLHDNKNNIDQSLIKALNNENVAGVNLKQILSNPYKDPTTGQWRNVLNIVMSDGCFLFVFRNSDPDDLAHQLSYKDMYNIWAVKSSDPQGGTTVGQFSLVILYRLRVPYIYENIFDNSFFEISAPSPQYLHTWRDTIRFGKSAAVDGDYMIVGIPNGQTLLDSTIVIGAAAVYQRNSTTKAWELYQLIQNPDSLQNSQFGYSVDIAGDYIIIGSPKYFSTSGENKGKVYVYEKGTNGCWDADDPDVEKYGRGPQDMFGYAVSINEDGDFCVGSPYTDINGYTDCGSATVFDFEGWYVYTVDGTYDNMNLGYDVDINSNGIAVAGAPNSDYLATDSGSLFFLDTAFNNSVEMSPEGLAADYHYGWAVGISDDVDAIPTAVAHSGNSNKFKFSFTGQNAHVIAGAPGISRAYIDCEDYVTEYSIDQNENLGHDVDVADNGFIVGNYWDAHITNVYIYDFSGNRTKKLTGYHNDYRECGQTVAYDGYTAVMASPEHNCQGYVLAYRINEPAGGGSYTPTEDSPDKTAIVSLLGNYPNPFNPSTSISFSLKEDTYVKLEVYNIKGQKVNILVKSQMEAGRHDIEWKGKDSSNKSVGSGVYFYRLSTHKTSKVGKMVLLK